MGAVVHWLQCLIRKWSCVNHQFQFHTQIAYKPTYMTHDLCYLLLLIIGTDIKLNHTNWAIHSSEHSHSLLTSASDSTSAQWRLLLHIWVTYVLGHPCHIWYSLGPKSLTHNHLTRAGPVKIRCAMTGMFDRKWEGCVSVPKHWGCFKWTLKIFARMTCWCVISLRVIKTMPYNGCSQMVSISLKIKNLSSPPPLMPAVRCWPWGVFSWWLASRDLGTARSSYLAWVGPVSTWTR